MAANDIQAKIKAGLAKAIKATGSATSEKVYLVTSTQGGTVLEPTQGTETKTELLNAVFPTRTQRVSDTNIVASTVDMVSNSDVVISLGDKVERGNRMYKVLQVEPISPTSDVLGYKSVLELI